MTYVLKNRENRPEKKFAVMQHKRFRGQGGQAGKGTKRRQAAEVVFQILTLTLSQGERGLKLHNVHNDRLRVHSRKSF
jgi:hypothetical protein